MYCPSTRQLAMDVSPQDKHKVVEQKPPYRRDRLPPEFVSFKTDPSGWRTMRKRSRRLDAQHDKACIPPRGLASMGCGRVPTAALRSTRSLDCRVAPSSA